MLALRDFDVLTFDCYGTLIDWERGILDAVRPVLGRHGVDAADERVLEVYGELESRAEAGEYLPYREVLARVMRGLGERSRRPTATWRGWSKASAIGRRSATRLTPCGR